MLHTPTGRDIRVHVLGQHGSQQKLHDPVIGFPFSWWDGVIFEPEIRDADLVWHFLGDRPYTSEVAEATQCLDSFSDEELERFVWYSLCDFPRFALKRKPGLKFLLSPGPDRARNREYNVHPVPIHCCVNDYEIQKGESYTREVRKLRKRYDFAFIGNVSGVIPSKFFGGRQWLTRLKLDRFLLINHAGSAFHAKWPIAHREWMKNMAQARYGFAPAGPSTGPRGFWTMQCGTVPIFSDVTHLPFDDQIDWEKIAVFVDQRNRETFDYGSLPMDGPEYEEKRWGCIEAWEKFCRIDSCAREMWRITCGYLSPGAPDSSDTTSSSTSSSTPTGT